MLSEYVLITGRVDTTQQHVPGMVRQCDLCGEDVYVADDQIMGDVRTEEFDAIHCLVCTKKELAVDSISGVLDAVKASQEAHYE